MNILFAWVLLSGSYMLGVSQAANNSSEASTVLVAEVIKNSPAEKAGLMRDDMIISITDASGTKHEKVNSSIIESTITSSNGSPVILTYKRADQTFSTDIKPESNVIQGKPAIGIAMADVSDVKYSFGKSIVEGAKMTYVMTVATTIGIFEFLKSIISFGADLSQVSGPVGIAGYLNQAREFGLSTLLSFVAVISINLAVINLLPFPALDGGRLLFVGIESVIRRRLNPRIANTLNVIGFVLLLALMVVITTSDISKLTVSH